MQPILIYINMSTGNLKPSSPSSGLEAVWPESNENGGNTENNSILGQRPQYELTLISSTLAYAEQACPGVSHRISSADLLAILSGLFRADPTVGVKRIFDPLNYPLPSVRTGPPSSFLMEVGKALTGLTRAQESAKPTLSPGNEGSSSRRARHEKGGKKQTAAGAVRQADKASKPNNSKVSKKASPQPPTPTAASTDRRELDKKRNRLLEKSLRSFRSKDWSEICLRYHVSEDDIRAAVREMPDSDLSVPRDDGVPPLLRLCKPKTGVPLIDEEAVLQDSWADCTTVENLKKAASSKAARAKDISRWPAVTKDRLVSCSNGTADSGILGRHSQVAWEKRVAERQVASRPALVESLRNMCSYLYLGRAASKDAPGPLVTVHPLRGTGNSSTCYRLTATCKLSHGHPFEGKQTLYLHAIRSVDKVGRSAASWLLVLSCDNLAAEGGFDRFPWDELSPKREASGERQGKPAVSTPRTKSDSGGGGKGPVTRTVSVPSSTASTSKSEPSRSASGHNTVYL